MNFRILGALMAIAVCSASAMPFSNRVTMTTGQKIFVNGINLAWKNYGNDVGDVALDAAYYDKAMKDLSDSGGNVMRIWLSTDGTHDPKYGADGLVSGLGTKTIANVQQMLQLARKHNILIMPVLMTHNFNASYLSSTQMANNLKLLQTDAGIAAYLKNAVEPLVKAIGKDPNLLCWEVFNEPEGLVQWNTPAIRQSDVQKVVNRVAGAIHRAVPGVLVSNGTNNFSTKDWYTDAALKAAGGDADGTLDFYMFHYYGWGGTSNSPFTKNAVDLGLDKPVVIGEFASSSWSTSTKHGGQNLLDAQDVNTAMQVLWDRGYAGGMYWQYRQDDADPWMQGFPTCGHPLATMFRAHRSAIEITPVLDTMKEVVATSTAGGTAVATPSGKVKPGTLVTLVARAEAGWEFLCWSGDTTAPATANPFVVKANKDMTVVAKFGPAAGTNLLKNGDFSGGSADWSTWVDKAGGDTAVITLAGGAAGTVLTATGTKNYLTQLYQGGLSLDSGVTYILGFDASSTGARPLGIGVKHDGNVDQKWSIGGYKYDDFTLSGSVQRFTSEFTMDTSDVAVVLQFNLGASLLPVTLDNVVLARKSGSVGGARPSVRPTSGLVVHRGDRNLSWTTTTSARTASILRVATLQGRVVARVLVPAGVSAGTIAADLPRSSLLLVGFEGDRAVAVQAP